MSKSTSMHDMFESFVGALLTSWETNGNPIGIDKHLQIRELLEASAANISFEKLKTLLAPLLVQNQQEQYEFYRLFDQLLRDQEAAIARHSLLVEAEIKAAKRDAGIQWWLNFVQQVKRLAGDFFDRFRANKFLVPALVLLAIIAGLLIRQFLQKPEVQDKKYEYFLLSEPNVPHRVCYDKPRGGPGIADIQMLEQPHFHDVGFEWQPNNFCIRYLRRSGQVDSMLFSIQTLDGKKQLVRFIFQLHKPKPNEWPFANHERPVNLSGDIRTGEQTDISFPQLNPVDSTQVLFDTARLVEKPSQYDSKISSGWELGLGYAYFDAGKRAMAALFAAILLAIGYWRQRQRQQFILKHHAGAKPPYSWTLRIPNSDNVHLGDQFYRAATEMRRRQEGTFSRLDVPTTIRTTIENGGLIQFKYQKQPLQKDYLILLDMQSAHNQRSRLFEEICMQWKANEVPIEFFYYNGDPRLCWNDQHAKGLTVNELYMRYPEHWLILWGSGHDFLSARTGALQPWSARFQRWRRRLILTPRSVADWDVREDILTQRFRLLPATPEGIGELVETLEAIEPKSHLLWKTQGRDESELLSWLPNAKGEALIQLLEAELVEYKHGVADDRLMQWVAGCALPPVLFWDWTLFVGEKLSYQNEYFLHSDHLFKILRLPWFAEGKMPPEVQSTLLNWLNQKYPAFLDVLRHEFDKIMHLETNLPPLGSIAWEGHRINLVLNQLMMKPKRGHRIQLEDELDQLLSTGLHESTLAVDYLEQTKTAVGNILSSRFRKFVQVKHGLFWRWRNWVWQLPVWVLLVSVTALLHYTVPVRTFITGSYVKSLAFSPDDKYLLIGSGDHRVSLWSAEGKWIRAFEGYKDEIISVDFGRDSSSVLTGCADNFIAFWDIWGQKERFQKGATDLISAIAFDPGKKFTVLASYETGKGVISIVDLEKNSISTQFKAHNDAITDIAIAPSGDAILSCSRDSLLKLWDMSGNLLATFKGHTDMVNAVDFSPNGDRVFSAGRDNTARMWSRDGNLLQIFKGHRSTVYDVDCAPDGSGIVTASNDYTARIWSLNGTVQRVFEGHYQPVHIARFSADGQRVATAGTDGMVKVWGR